MKADDSTTNKLGPDDPGPQLEEVDDSERSRFEPLPPTDNWWVPGLVEIVFKTAAQSGVMQLRSPNESERKAFSPAWPESLRNVLHANGLLHWKPSFPERYPWSTDSAEKAREKYQKSGRARFVTLTFPPEAETPRIADELRGLPEIEEAVAVPQIGPPCAPIDEPLMGTTDQATDIFCGPDGCLETQWYIFRCGINRAWDKATGIGVTIADIDWGFNAHHEDLESRIQLTRSVVPLTNSGDVANGQKCAHGTAALGLAGARVNHLGMAGIAFNANLWAIQAGTDAVVNFDLWAEAIYFVIDEPSDGPKVIILEIQTRKCGNIEMNAGIRQAIADAINARIVVCVPAGNGNRTFDAGIGDDGNPIPPTGSILVGATRFHSSQNIAANTNRGSRVVVYAPGDPNHDVTCGLSNTRYRKGFGGTSSAVAKVAGVAALMLERNPNLTHDQIRSILAGSQIPVVDNSSNQVGVLLDAEQAVCEAGAIGGNPC
jgi:subtilisin family serine protease